MENPINIQFFITIKELILNVRNWNDLYKLHLGNINLNPSFNFELLDVSTFENVIISNANRSDNHLALSRMPFILKANRFKEFEEDNPNSLFIHIGQTDNMFIKESSMVSLKILTDELAYGIWKKIGKEIKQKTICGAFGIYEPTGNRTYNKNLRYTVGVKNDFDKGISILPSFGKNVHYEINLY